MCPTAEFPIEGDHYIGVVGDDPGPARLEWIDAARGIGIILVVAGHVERGLVGAGIANTPGWSTFDTALYTFHIPLFMLLAGLNIPKSFSRGRSTFLRGKFWSIAYPYVLWSIIQSVIFIELARLTHKSGDWVGLAELGWRPIAQFWFLYALMGYMIVIAAVGLRSAVLVPLAIAGLLLYNRLGRVEILQLALFNFAFFVAGVLLSEYLKRLSSRNAPLGALLAAAGWAVAYALLVPATGPKPYLTLLALPCAACGIAGVILLARALPLVAAQWFARLGIWSMSIYVMHVMAESGVRLGLSMSHLRLPAAAYFVICLAAGLAAPIVAHLILERLGWLWLFGLGKRGHGFSEHQHTLSPQPSGPGSGAVFDLAER